MIIIKCSKSMNYKKFKFQLISIVQKIELKNKSNYLGITF